MHRGIAEMKPTCKVALGLTSFPDMQSRLVPNLKPRTSSPFITLHTGHWLWRHNACFRSLYESLCANDAWYHLSVSWRASSAPNVRYPCECSSHNTTSSLVSAENSVRQSGDGITGKFQWPTWFRPLLPTPSGVGGLIAPAQRVQSSALSHITSHVFTVSITTVHKTEIEYVTNARAKPFP